MDDSKIDPTSDDKVREALDEAADKAQRPHDEAEDRRRQAEDTTDAGYGHREGEGTHPTE